MFHFRRVLGGVLVLVCAGITVPAAQEPAEEPAFVFRAGTDLVQVDVSVLDDGRRPVRGLTAGDFIVLEDGEPRPIETFAAVDLAERATAGAAWMREVPRDVAVNSTANAEGRLVVILMDRSIPVGQPTIVARDSAMAIVDALGPGDMAALVSTSGGVPQNFTADRARLVRAIARGDWSAGTSAEADEIDSRVHAEGLFTSLTDPRCLCGLCQPHTITRVADALEDLSRRRKSIVFIGKSFTFQAGPMQQQVELGCGQKLEDAREVMFDALDRSGVTVHAIDPTGLQVIGPIGQASSTVRGDRARGRWSQAVQTELEDVGELHVLPDRTGGRVVMNTNAPETRVTEIVDESQSYYLLGFRPSADGPLGQPRSIEVRVDRSGVAVHARREFVVGGSDAGDEQMAPSDALVAGLLPNGDLPMDLSVAAFAAPGSGRAALAVSVGVQSLAPPDAGSEQTESLEVVATAYDQAGRPQASARQTLEVSWPAATGPATSPRRVDVLSRLDLEPGDYEVRVAALAGGSRRASVFTQVTVPPFAGARLTLSHLALAATPTTSSAPPEFLEAVLPIRPTPQRAFRRTENATAFLRIYQGTTRTEPIEAVIVRVRIVDAGDRDVRDQGITLPAEAFATDRGANLRLTLPVAHLAPGEYLLRLEAAAGENMAGRAIRFEVQ